MKDALDFMKAVVGFLTVWKRNSAGQILERYGVIQELVDHEVQNGGRGINRLLLFQAHNCGGNFSIDCPKYVTCHFSGVSSPFVDRRKELQRVELDPPTQDILRRLYRNKILTLHTKDIEDGAAIRMAYEAERISHSTLFFIRDSKRDFWFASVVSSNELNNLSDANTKWALRLLFNQIKNKL